MPKAEDVYSPYKPLRHKDILRAIETGKAARPAHVQLILTNKCNQKCKHCAYRDKGYSSSQKFDQRKEMPLDKAIEIIEDCAEIGVSAIQFTGGGEPTLHPDFATIIDYTQHKGIAYSVVTNGSLVVNRGLEDALARAAWVRISLDAGTPQGYVNQRRTSAMQYEHALEAIRAIDERRKALGTDCILGVGFVVTPDNYMEARRCAYLAKSCGADNIRISAQFSGKDEKLYSGCYSQAVASTKEAEEEATPTFQVFNRFSDRIGDLVAKSPEYDSCGYQYYTTYVGADLRVYRCCVLAYNDQGDLGSLEHQRFKDLWFSKNRLDNMHSHCARNCKRCQFNNINKLIDYTTSPDQRAHEGFV